MKNHQIGIFIKIHETANGVLTFTQPFLALLRKPEKATVSRYTGAMVLHSFF